MPLEWQKKKKKKQTNKKNFTISEMKRQLDSLSIRVNELTDKSLKSIQSEGKRRKHF